MKANALERMRRAYGEWFERNYVLVPEGMTPVQVVQSKRIAKPFQGTVVGNSWGSVRRWLGDCDPWEHCHFVVHLSARPELLVRPPANPFSYGPVFGTFIWSMGIFEGSLQCCGFWDLGPPINFAICTRPWSRYLVEWWLRERCQKSTTGEAMGLTWAQLAKLDFCRDGD